MPRIKKTTIGGRTKRKASEASSSRRQTRGESSSQPTAPPPKFLKPGTIETNKYVLRSRKIIPGRMVDLSGEPHVFGAFSAVKWTFCLELEEHYYPDLVREFYAGYVFDEENRMIYVTMFGINYSWTLNDFCNRLGLEGDGIGYYTESHDLKDLKHISHYDRTNIIKKICGSKVDENTTTILGKDLVADKAFWAKILDHNVYMKGGNHSKIPAMVAMFLYEMAEKDPSNMGYFIAKRMSNIPHKTKRLIPYGRLLNRLFRSMEIELINPEIPKDKPLNSTTLKKMTKQPTKRYRDEDDDSFEEEDEFDDEEEESEESSHHSAGPSNVDLDRPVTYREHLEVKRLAKKNNSLLKKILGYVKKAFPNCSPPRNRD